MLPFLVFGKLMLPKFPKSIAEIKNIDEFPANLCFLSRQTYGSSHNFFIEEFHINMAEGEGLEHAPASPIYLILLTFFLRIFRWGQSGDTME